MRVVIVRGRVSIGDFLLGGVLILRDVVRFYVSFSFLSFLDTLFLYMGLVTILTYIILIFFIY